MRKLFIVYLIVITGILVSGTVAYGDTATTSPNTLLNLYSVEDSFAVGLQQHLWGNFYGAADVEYWNSLQDLRFQASALYFIPREALFFKFYGGIGDQFSRDSSSYNYPYIIFGTRFLFFFAEALYPWAKQVKPEYRLGFSLDFSKGESKTSETSQTTSSSGEVTEAKSVQYDYDLAPNIETIKIDNQFGKVEVKTGAAGVVSLTADIEIHAAYQKDMELYRDDFKITGTPQGNNFMIQTQIPKSKGDMPIPGVTVNMLVYVPAGITFEVNGNEVKPFVNESN